MSNIPEGKFPVGKLFYVTQGFFVIFIVLPVYEHFYKMSKYPNWFSRLHKNVVIEKHLLIPVSVLFFVMNLIKSTMCSYYLFIVLCKVIPYILIYFNFIFLPTRSDG